MPITLFMHVFAISLEIWIASQSIQSCKLYFTKDCKLKIYLWLNLQYYEVSGTCWYVVKMDPVSCRASIVAIMSSQSHMQ